MSITWSQGKEWITSIVSTKATKFTLPKAPKVETVKRNSFPKLTIVGIEPRVSLSSAYTANRSGTEVVLLIYRVTVTGCRKWKQCITIATKIQNEKWLACTSGRNFLWFSTINIALNPMFSFSSTCHFHLVSTEQKVYVSFLQISLYGRLIII